MLHHHLTTDFLIAGAADIFRHLHAHQVGLTHRSVQVVLADQHGTHLSNASESTNGEVLSPARSGDFPSQRPQVKVGRQGVDADAGAVGHFQMIEMQLQVATAVCLPNRPYRLRSGGHDNLAVSYTHLRAHETVLDLVCRLLLEKKKKI